MLLKFIWKILQLYIHKEAIFFEKNSLLLKFLESLLMDKIFQHNRSIV